MKEPVFTADEVVECLQIVAERYRKAAADILLDPKTHFKPAYPKDTPEEASKLLVLTAWNFDLVAKLVKGELQEYANRKNLMTPTKDVQKEKSQEVAAS